VLAALGGYAWWRDEGSRLFFPRNFGVVEEGFLYRSGQIHPRIIEDVLRDHQIDVVIDLARDDLRLESARAEIAAVEALGIRKVDLPGLDGYGVGRLDSYATALEELALARYRGDRVLVHCSAGSERTGATVALYRMLFEGWSGEQAYAEYLQYRNRPPGHRKLPDYLNRNMPRLVARLVEQGVLAQAPDPLPVFGSGVLLSPDTSRPSRSAASPRRRRAASRRAASR
jgi:protein tyrosine/serine phosphatase